MSSNRIVEWEGEWKFLRSVSNSIVTYGNGLNRIWNEQSKTTKETVTETSQTASSFLKDTQHQMRQFSKDYPLVVVPFVGSLSAVALRRPNATPMAFVRTGLVGMAAAMVIIYPDHFAQLVSNPKQYFEKQVKPFYTQ